MPVLSRRALAASLSVLLTAGLAVTSERRALAASSGPDVSYPLLHDFSLVPGIPGHGKHEPTSCYDRTDPEYLCRIVSGYEETGDKRNFLVRQQDALDDGSDPTYGHALVSRAGIQYEGCRRWRNGDWHCDYATRRHVPREHYEDKRWVLRVMWDWGKHTAGQAGCASALSGWWGKTLRFPVVLKSCLNGPLENPGRR